jgi:hypothetical protein
VMSNLWGTCGRLSLCIQLRHFSNRFMPSGQDKVQLFSDLVNVAYCKCICVCCTGKHCVLESVQGEE